jgi:hypothetical protein
MPLDGVNDSGLPRPKLILQPSCPCGAPGARRRREVVSAAPRHMQHSAHVTGSATRPSWRTPQARWRRSAAPTADGRKSLWRGKRATILPTGSDSPGMAGAIVQPLGAAQSKGKKRSVRSTGACEGATLCGRRLHAPHSSGASPRVRDPAAKPGGSDERARPCFGIRARCHGQRAAKRQGVGRAAGR